jgi:hypothetical protein
MVGFSATASIAYLQAFCAVHFSYFCKRDGSLTVCDPESRAIPYNEGRALRECAHHRRKGAAVNLFEEVAYINRYCETEQSEQKQIIWFVNNAGEPARIELECYQCGKRTAFDLEALVPNVPGIEAAKQESEQEAEANGRRSFLRRS